MISRKLIYNANHRGLKEMDVLLGGFANRHMVDISTENLLTFERLLEEQDADILDWCLGKMSAPAEYQGIIEMIVNRN